MCYDMEEFQQNDPCAEDLESMGYNQYIDWDDDTQTCEITFSESEAGEWDINIAGELCLMFEAKSETVIVCSE